MSQDICRGDWCLDFCGFVFSQLSNITNNNFGKVTVSKIDDKIFSTKYTTIYTIYFINSGLLDAPCNNFHFFFVFSQICLVQQQTMSNISNKKICGGLLSCKPRYCTIWHLEALEYFWLCGNMAFSETMRCVIFFWTAPCLIIVELQVVVNVWAMHATVEFWRQWHHIQKDAQKCDASAGVSLDEIQRGVFV